MLVLVIIQTRTTPIMYCLFHIWPNNNQLIRLMENLFNEVEVKWFFFNVLITKYLTRNTIKSTVERHQKYTFY